MSATTDLGPSKGSGLALIPARGGSKRIPRKNLRKMGGRPAIEWVIQAAQRSELFSRIVVSTDDEEIASVAESAGAEVPFTRPPELGNDNASIRSVVQHALRIIDSRTFDAEAVCCLYPTAVLLDPKDLIRSLERWRAHREYSAMLAVTAYSHPVQRAMTLGADGQVTFMSSLHAEIRTQDLQMAVHDAAQFCWASSRTWLGSTSILENSLGYLLPNWRAIDIDNEDDWTHAALVQCALTHFST